MRRKLIKQGGGGLTFYVPKKWTDMNNLKPGDEIEIDEQNNSLVISSEKHISIEKKKTIDISNLDRSSFLKLYTALYEGGYDEVKFTFTKNKVHDYKANKKISISDYIVKYTDRFQGFAIVSQGKNYYVIKDISIQSGKEFDNILRRIFYLIIEFNKIIITSIKSKDFSELEKYQEMHDNITKFVSFCLRLLNKSSTPDREKYTMYLVINTLDLIVDYNRYLCEDLLRIKKISKEGFVIISRVTEIFRVFYNYYYKNDYENIKELMKLRFNLKNKISRAKLPTKELVIVTRYSSVFELTHSVIKCIAV